MENESKDVNVHYKLNKKFEKIGVSTIWTELTPLVIEYNAVNLGQVN